jgi:hypothetical protein
MIGEGFQGMRCSIKTYEVSRSDIAYLKFIIEGYEGVAMMRTLDAGQALVAVHMAPGAEDEVSDILNQLASEIELHETAFILNEDDTLLAFDTA